MKDKHILYVTHRFPYPPAGGAKVRAFHSIRHLAKQNRVTVAAPVRDAEEADAVSGLEAQGVAVMSALISPQRAIAQSLFHAATLKPASMGYFRSPTLERQVRRLISRDRPDLIIVHCSSVAPWVAAASVPKVLDFVDMDSCKWQDYARFHQLPRAFIYGYEGWSMRRAENRLANAFDLNLVTTVRERESLLEIAGPVRAEVVKNGVDLDYFTPQGGDYDRDLICFVGRMDYFPNAHAMVDFCANTLPLIRRRRPATRLDIIGAAPGPEVKALAAIDGVTVTGTVDDVRGYVKRAALSVAPLAIARGTQNKILEAMAMGVPVVASRLAAGGVEATPGEHLLASDGPEETAAAILSLLEDRDLRAGMAERARRHIRESYSWDRAMASLEDAIGRLVD